MHFSAKLQKRVDNFSVTSGCVFPKFFNIATGISEPDLQICIVYTMRASATLKAPVNPEEGPTKIISVSGFCTFSGTNRKWGATRRRKTLEFSQPVETFVLSYLANTT